MGPCQWKLSSGEEHVCLIGSYLPTTMWPAALAEAACAYKNDPHTLVVCFFLTKPPIFPLQWI